MDQPGPCDILLENMGNDIHSQNMVTKKTFFFYAVKIHFYKQSVPIKMTKKQEYNISKILESTRPLTSETTISVTFESTRSVKYDITRYVKKK